MLFEVAYRVIIECFSPPLRGFFGSASPSVPGMRSSAATPSDGRRIECRSGAFVWTDGYTVLGQNRYSMIQPAELRAEFWTESQSMVY